MICQVVQANAIAVAIVKQPIPAPPFEHERGIRTNNAVVCVAKLSRRSGCPVGPVQSSQSHRKPSRANKPEVHFSQTTSAWTIDRSFPEHCSPRAPPPPPFAPAAGLTSSQRTCRLRGAGPPPPPRSQSRAGEEHRRRARRQPRWLPTPGCECVAAPTLQRGQSFLLGQARKHGSAEPSKRC